jgi:hypothetical protein
MPESYVDLQPETVTVAGRATAATSTQWSQWAGRTETLLRNAGADAHESVITAAVEEHLATWNPRMKGLATNADALGTNAVSATQVMLGADGTSTTTLNQQEALERRHGSSLRRPISL